MERKIVQIAVMREQNYYCARVFAVADDGTLWAISITHDSDVESEWVRLPELPQDDDLTTEA